MEALLLVAAGVLWAVLGPVRRWVGEVPGSNEDFIYF
jgi:hypothetical protein